MSFENLFLESGLFSLFDSNPVTYVDIGTRGGFESDLLPIAFCTNVVGFEPEEGECSYLQKLSRTPWKSRLILPNAVGDTNQSARLYIPEDPRAASLLRAKKEICDPFHKTQFFDPIRELEVEMATLRHSLHEVGILDVDYLKIDVEGAEHLIIASSQDIIAELGAIKLEVSFLPFRENHPVAAELELSMSELGFQLFDLLKPAHWRYQGDIIHPFADDLPIPYSKGQLVHGDYLFFRRIDKLRFDSENDLKKALKTAILAMAFGYFDYAHRILKHRSILDTISALKIKDVEKQLGYLSRRYGRKAFRDAMWRHARLCFTYLSNLGLAR
ncbi:MAG: hypothetical protein CBB68_07030 [Rhodospirillaceae bacterium TMED8]|nr:hypothetical protein [Magnetovibrio sp.]OUT50747.1 MAG: hypothetical protein CBB68_07030 [Rhodospirillaceae bacterium TMED8]